ncbi:hypothetical protein LTR37_012916 [Vermiconidia calcicola]|uniref:Uncharacterized protein n=1 Tax=Vermiconidia calcicola TaxID=1690605 RepID=A0ACC3MXT3_9PEZI|nr:hypothetical protein LTR37_012916 [Vermiconidia calcicola]
MGAPSIAPSALQSFLGSTGSDSSQETQLLQLALQIAHNLRYQHNWDDIRIHYDSTTRIKSQPPIRPLISGFPPQRLYVHPDEQIEVLQKQKDEGKAGMPDLPREREWVLPSHLREKWSLRRFGEVFNAISTVPPQEDGEALFDDSKRAAHTKEGGDDSMEGAPTNKWRISQPKRLLLATLDDDSTVVYYIVHDGIVKPRQN